MSAANVKVELFAARMCRTENCGRQATSFMTYRCGIHEAIDAARNCSPSDLVALKALIKSVEALTSAERVERERKWSLSEVERTAEAAKSACIRAQKAGVASDAIDKAEQAGRTKAVLK